MRRGMGEKDSNNDWFRRGFNFAAGALTFYLLLTTVPLLIIMIVVMIAGLAGLLD
jgi:uncharacterized BrkB/YihY/UPF0761 family membrane protein